MLEQSQVQVEGLVVGLDRIEYLYTGCGFLDFDPVGIGTGLLLVFVEELQSFSYLDVFDLVALSFHPVFFL
jgi:hypothetical protein